MPIQSFKCKSTENLIEGGKPRKFRNIESVAARKLQMMDSVVELRDLRAPPGNRLEELSGNRAGQHSIRINDQWRICFKFENGHFLDVEIVDYH